MSAPTPSPPSKLASKQDTLSYHEFPTPGKIKIIPSKPCNTKDDLSLAYTPGVAEPCKIIEKDPSAAYKYTSKGNLVAVITNGTAVLGLGDIGALAGKPVMEGKSVLFKRFAGLDSIDIEINEKDPQKFIEIVKSLEPTFGGINLEDIKAPECFEIEQTLITKMNIPIMHDDQHGTAIICSAALLNAIPLAKKRIHDVKVVFSGAGAAAISCATLFVKLGVHKENLLLVDSKGVITTARMHELNPEKQQFAVNTSKHTLQDALVGADVFVGLSQANIMSKEMLLSMNENPIVFAMANPTPEIDYTLAISTRNDVIMATGRSDYPNQINNVLAFPYLFRAALDTRSSKITPEMKLACVKALASLAKKKVPASVEKAYGQKFEFGRTYLIPKPFDPRVLSVVTPKIAQAAIECGAATFSVDIKEYEYSLAKMANRLAKGKW